MNKGSTVHGCIVYTCGVRFFCFSQQLSRGIIVAVPNAPPTTHQPRLSLSHGSCPFPCSRDSTRRGKSNRISVRKNRESHVVSVPSFHRATNRSINTTPRAHVIITHGRVHTNVFPFYACSKICIGTYVELGRVEGKFFFATTDFHLNMYDKNT